MREGECIAVVRCRVAWRCKRLMPPSTRYQMMAADVKAEEAG